MVRLPIPFGPKIVAKGAEVPFNKEQITLIFKKQDKNGDGKLSHEEVKAAFVELNAFWPWFRTVQGFRHGDSNGDKFINIDDQELENLVDFTLKCGYTRK
jgi:hypothetical protein